MQANLKSLCLSLQLFFIMFSISVLSSSWLSIMSGKVIQMSQRKLIPDSLTSAGLLLSKSLSLSPNSNQKSKTHSSEIINAIRYIIPKLYRKKFKNIISAELEQN